MNHDISHNFQTTDNNIIISFVTKAKAKATIKNIEFSFKLMRLNNRDLVIISECIIIITQSK